MSSTATGWTLAKPSISHQLPEQQTAPAGSSGLRYYRDVCGNSVTLVETRHGCGGGGGKGAGDASGPPSGAIEYVLRLESRRGYAGADLALLCTGLALWTAYGSPAYALVGLLGLALAFRSALLTDRTNTLLLVESVGVQITNKQTIFGAAEEYLPWSSIKDIFINEVICEQKVLYYLTFIVKELTSNGEEKIRFHWENQNQESILTVPGSYWLCHKNNIYKFTFKLHKTIRNTTSFAYSKELMKIIRRVIKWQPKQGQHFSTRNLLVTYNHVSWTRHDKSFAVMKFCDRPDAIAFPHAFILTVKLLGQEEQPQIHEMGAKSSKHDADKKTEGELTLNQLTHENKTMEGQSEEDGDAVDVNREMQNSKNDDISWSLRTRSCHIRTDSPIIIDSPARYSLPQDPEKTTNGIKDNLIISDASNKNINSSNANINTDTNLNTDACINNHHEEACKSSSMIENTSSSVVKDSVTLHIENENSNCSDSSIDSANLPYQYLIERDIERELEISRLAQSEPQETEELQTTSTSPTDLPNCESSVIKNSEDNIDFNKSPGSPRKSGKFRSRQNSKDSDMSPPPEVANLRSSNITDLVMKGLMFTIRQDKDTVTVVEQKTKVELDEVLENSEKVETKEGDPCLLNSSLLRLEKMVTRMQEPTSLPDQRRNGENPLVSYVDLVHNSNLEIEADVAEKKDEHQSNNSFESANCWSDFFGNQNMTDSSFEKMEKALNETSIYINGDDPEDEIKLKIESRMDDEDIVPEAYSKYFNISNSSRKMPLTEEDIQDLLMDDFDYKDPIVAEGLEINAEMSNNSHSTKDSSKLPKIISNEIITNEQLPEMLLKAIQNKFVNQKHEINTNKIIDDCENISVNNNDKSIVKHVDSEMNIDNSLENEIKITDNHLELDENIKTLNSDSEILSNKEENLDTDSVNSVKTEVAQITEKNQEVICTEVTTKKKSSKNIVKKNIDSHDTNSNSLDNSRMTRSNSKLQSISSDIPVLSDSNKSSLIVKRYVERRSHRILETDINISKDKSLETRICGQNKRKQSVSDKFVTKVQKSENISEVLQKDVSINVQKLMKDLKYGVKVVVKRLDSKDISTK